MICRYYTYCEADERFLCMYNLMIFDVYRKCCVFSKFYHYFPQSRITIKWNHKDSNIPLFLPCISAIFAPCRCNTRQRTIRSSSPEKAIHKVEEDKPSEFFVGFRAARRVRSGKKISMDLNDLNLRLVVLQDYIFQRVVWDDFQIFSRLPCSRQLGLSCSPTGIPRT